MISSARSGLVGLALIAFAGCKIPGVSKSKTTKLEVTMGTLSADPLSAARELGSVAAKGKDEPELAGKLLALLQRLGVPVVSTDGSKALVVGKLSSPPKEIYFWEPMIVGLARATVKGDTRPMSTILRSVVPKGDRALATRIDYTGMFALLAADAAAEKASTPDAILVTAIAEDLKLRGEPRSDPRIDPVGAALFSLWLSLYKPPPPPAGAASVLPPGMPSNFPGLPPGFKLPAVKNQIASGGAGGAGGAACAWMDGAMKGFGKAKTGVDWGTAAAGKYVPGSAGAASKATQDFMSKFSAATALPGTALEGIVGMAIAAFFDVTGEVKPPKIKYGDAAASLEVKVVSTNPFSKDQMDSFINCLERTVPGATGLDELRNIPPAGPIEDVPVVWGGFEELDPKHGTFTVDPAHSKPKAGIDGVITFAKNTGRSVGAAAKISFSDSGGLAKAEMKPKPKKGGDAKFTSVVKSFIINSESYPFPVGKSAVYLPANLLFSRDLPLRLEIEIPFPRNWILTLHEELSGAQAGGWNMVVDGKVPFSLDPKDPKRKFTGTGEGTWTAKLASGTFGGLLTCDAPVGSHPVDMVLSGEILDLETFSTRFRLDVTGRQTAVKAMMKCRAPGGYEVNREIGAPTSGGSSTANTPIQNFTMFLDDGKERAFTIRTPAGNDTMQGPATITLTPAD